MTKANAKVVAAAPKKRFKLSFLTPYFMVMPAIAFLCVFTLYPMGNLIHLSMYKGSAANPYKQFLGLDNFHTLLFVKKDFKIALYNTAVYTVAVVVLLIVLAVLFALWCYKDNKLNSIAETCFFTPHLVASISCAFIFSWIFSSNEYGLANTVMKALGLPTLKWLDSSQTAMGCIIFMNVWKSIGYYMLIVMSALKAIPTEIYEAASLDNSTGAKTFFKITLPMLTPQLFFMLITITTGSFKVFDSVRTMTNGGPGDSTQVLCLYIYSYAFQRNNTLGLGCAAGVILMLILILITLLDFKGLERKVHYQ